MIAHVGGPPKSVLLLLFCVLTNTWKWKPICLYFPRDRSSLWRANSTGTFHADYVCSRLLKAEWNILLVTLSSEYLLITYILVVRTMKAHATLQDKSFDFMPESFILSPQGISDPRDQSDLFLEVATAKMKNRTWIIKESKVSCGCSNTPRASPLAHPPPTPPPPPICVLSIHRIGCKGFQYQSIPRPSRSSWICSWVWNFKFAHLSLRRMSIHLRATLVRWRFCIFISMDVSTSSEARSGNTAETTVENRRSSIRERMGDARVIRVTSSSARNTRAFQRRSKWNMLLRSDSKSTYVLGCSRVHWQVQFMYLIIVCSNSCYTLFCELNAYMPRASSSVRQNVGDVHVCICVCRGGGGLGRQYVCYGTGGNTVHHHQLLLQMVQVVAYASRPFLLNGCKFDIRCWVLVDAKHRWKNIQTSFHDLRTRLLHLCARMPSPFCSMSIYIPISVYLHKQGVCRTCSVRGSTYFFSDWWIYIDLWE